MGAIYIGLSGFSYKPWQGEGRFYPRKLPAASFLEYYAGRYDAVEMDGTWYKMPTPEVVAKWIAGTPDRFRFSFKAHRRITHLTRLKPDGFENVRFQCKRLAAIAALDRLGPFLVQLPPNFKKDEERLSAFVAALPETFDTIEDYSGPPGRKARWAMEFRHPSWDCDAVADILGAKNVAWVASDTDETPATKRNTADFLYTRLRRTEFTREELDTWAGYFSEAVDAGQDCFVYCKHEDEGSPWEWADYLRTRINR